jgi:plastocyanin
MCPGAVTGHEPMPRPHHIALLALAGLPLLVACGDEEPAPSPGQPAAAAPPALVVDLSASQFSPATARAHVGEEITFVNRDAIAHTATATVGAAFDSGAMQEGARFTFTPRRSGLISLVCVIHPGMTGAIRVS